MESSHFWPSVLHDKNYKTVFFSIFDLGSLTPKIYSPTFSSMGHWVSHSLCHRLWVNDIWARRGDPVAYRLVIIITTTKWHVFLCNIQCQIELPKLVSELDSNQLVTSSLLADLDYFLDVQHQLTEYYRASYTAGNTSLEAVAKGIPYDVITATVGTKKVRYFFVIGQKSRQSVGVFDVLMRLNSRPGLLTQ